MFYSSTEKKLVTLEEYTSRMKEGQENIYYACGESNDKVDNMPQVELIKDKGYEILYLTDQVDEFVLQVLMEYEGKKFVNVCANSIDLDTEEEKEKLEKIKERLTKEKEELEKFKDEVTKTSDGYVVELVANIGTPADVDIILKNSAEGVGLLRSEFLYMDSEKMPTEEEQFLAYKEVAEKMEDRPVIIRTLDVGGDKKLKYLQLEKEDNPFLGYRAIRLCLDNVSLFKTQLRAILRASTYGNLSIMFPMISSIEELRDAKKVLEECKKELDKKEIKYKKNIKVGIMIEIPSAALISYGLAKECDFFSIGTNDLIQYTIAVERGNAKIAKLYTKYHPAVIKLIKQAIDGAHDAGIFCGMCGEAAGDELYIPLLIGLGLDEFSMNSNNILKARKRISELEKFDCKELAEEILRMTSAKDVEEKLKEFSKRVIIED